MIASYLRKREAAAFEDFGLDRQAEFFEREADRLGHAPPVVDAGDVLADPEGTLSRALRARSASPWDPAMLALAAGPPRHRRPLGAALVPGGRGLDRLRPARPAARRPARRGPPPRRALPPLLRAPRRAPAWRPSGAVTLGCVGVLFLDLPASLFAAEGTVTVTVPSLVCGESDEDVARVGQARNSG